MCKGTTLSSTAAYSKKTKNKKKHTDSENFLNTHAEMEHLTVL
jgi:hypothetical protein